MFGFNDISKNLSNFGKNNGKVEKKTVKESKNDLFSIFNKVKDVEESKNPDIKKDIESIIKSLLEKLVTNEDESEYSDDENEKFLGSSGDKNYYISLKLEDSTGKIISAKILDSTGELMQEIENNEQDNINFIDDLVNTMKLDSISYQLLLDVGIIGEKEAEGAKAEAEELGLDDMTDEEELESPEETQEEEMPVESVKETKAEHRGDAVFQSDSSKVKDKKDHFPINDADQARNALARVAQYDAVPEWYDGSLEELQTKVRNSVKKKFPSIEVSEKNQEKINKLQSKLSAKENEVRGESDKDKKKKIELKIKELINKIKKESVKEQTQVLPEQHFMLHNLINVIQKGIINGKNSETIVNDIMLEYTDLDKEDVTNFVEEIKKMQSDDKEMIESISSIVEDKLKPSKSSSEVEQYYNIVKGSKSVQVFNLYPDVVRNAQDIADKSDEPIKVTDINGNTLWISNVEDEMADSSVNTTVEEPIDVSSIEEPKLEDEEVEIEDLEKEPEEIPEEKEEEEEIEDSVIPDLDKSIDKVQKDLLEDSEEFEAGKVTPVDEEVPEEKKLDDNQTKEIMDTETVTSESVIDEEDKKIEENAEESDDTVENTEIEELRNRLKEISKEESNLWHEKIRLTNEIRRKSEESNKDKEDEVEESKIPDLSNKPEDAIKDLLEEYGI